MSPIRLKAVLSLLFFVCAAEARASFLAFDTHALALDPSCGVSLQGLRAEIEARAREVMIPVPVLLALIQEESRGSCTAKKNERDGSTSMGLVQINSKTTGYVACSSDDLSKIAGSRTLAELRLAPKCIANPVFNLKLMAQVFKQKERALKLPELRVRLGGKIFFFDGFPELDRHPQFRLNLLLAAFNGGEVWVAETAELIAQINLERNGVKLNKYSWSDFESVLVRQALTLADQRRLIGWRTRLQSMAEVNAAYVRDILEAAKTRFRR